MSDLAGRRSTHARQWEPTTGQRHRGSRIQDTRIAGRGWDVQRKSAVGRDTEARVDGRAAGLDPVCMRIEILECVERASQNGAGRSTVGAAARNQADDFRFVRDEIARRL